MEYAVHGRIIEWNGHECGEFRCPDVFSYHYVPRDVGVFVSDVNSLPIEIAIGMLNECKRSAYAQLDWDASRYVFNGHGEIPIEKAKKNIRNRAQLAQLVLNTLETK